MTNVTSEFYKEKLTLTYLLVLIFLLIVTDVSMDILAGIPLKAMVFDCLIEGAIMAVVLFTTRYTWKKFKLEKKSKDNIVLDLNKTKQQATEWEKKSKQFINEFQVFVLRQFELWKFSNSEKEIALLILQGKSSKDMATIRFTSERTIRNQCRAIYEKSSQAGKNELLAFFLDQLIQGISVK